jgi:hypothetical protein
MKHTPRALVLLCLPAALSLAACAAATGPTAAIDSTATLAPATTQTAAPTATIVWFPPTPTASPITAATQVPTPEHKPGIGAIALTDDFSVDALWNTGVSNQGSAVLSASGLTLAVPPGSYIYRLRNAITLGDFYAELTAHLGLCKGPDEYGLLVRASAAASYRYSLTCDGTARLDRVRGSSREILHTAIPSGDVPIGAPGEVVLGVWAVGSDLRFFLNGHYQFSVNDRNYLSGTLGVFAHSAGTTPVTITFSGLVVYDVNYSPTATPTP